MPLLVVAEGCPRGQDVTQGRIGLLLCGSRSQSPHLFG